jgi:uncharacterized protein YqeY
MKKFSTVQEIQAERQNQRANDIIYTMLGVLLGEIDRLPTRETPTEDQIYSAVNKMYNNAKEMVDYNPGNTVAKVEMAYLQDYIKKQFSEAELTGIILALKEEGYKTIGEFMKALNTLYKGRFDGKTASMIINKILKEGN